MIPRSLSEPRALSKPSSSFDEPFRSSRSVCAWGCQIFSFLLFVPKKFTPGKVWRRFPKKCTRQKTAEILVTSRRWVLQAIYAVTALTLVLVRTLRFSFGEGGTPLSFGERTGNLIGWLKEEASDRLGVEGGKARGALARPSKRTWRMAHGRRAPAGHRGRSWRASARSASPNRTS